MVDIIIVGAGIAGLTAATELKRHGISFVVLEASAEPGGRALTRRAASGVPIDMGAHWLHGSDNPLNAVVERYGIPHHKDTDNSSHVIIYQHGKAHHGGNRDRLKQAINAKKAKQIENGDLPDCALADLAVNEEGRQTLMDFDLMWSGIDPPVFTSAREFLTDESTPGGWQLQDGIGALTAELAEEAAPENIFYNAPVTRITSSEDGVRLYTADGKAWKARMAIFTGSLGVIKSGTVAFTPPLNPAMQEHLSGLVMGKMNKIIAEVKPEFFKERNIPKNLSLLLLDARPPHFCHVHGAGSPLINLFISGSQAEKIESLSPADARDYLKNVLAPVKELAGFEDRLAGEPVITKWVGNPFTRGAYSSVLPGKARSGPRLEGRVVFCGDTFDKNYPSALAGAYLSAKAAVQMVVKLMRL